MKTPEYYKAPLRKKADIIQFLLKQANRRHYDRRAFLFCFDVKIYNLDLSFDNLLKVAKEHGDIDNLDDVMFLAGAKEQFAEHENILFDWAIEDARETFTGRQGPNYYRPDDDGFNMLWDGTEIDVEFAFLGRSGGWLCITHWEGVALESEENLNDFSYKQLRALYRYIVMLQADLKRHTPSARVEEKAAWALFVNLCSDVVTSTEAAKAV